MLLELWTWQGICSLLAGSAGFVGPDRMLPEELHTISNTIRGLPGEPFINSVFSLGPSLPLLAILLRNSRKDFSITSASSRHAHHCIRRHPWWNDHGGFVAAGSVQSRERRKQPDLQPCKKSDGMACNEHRGDRRHANKVNALLFCFTGAGLASTALQTESPLPSFPRPCAIWMHR